MGQTPYPCVSSRAWEAVPLGTPFTCHPCTMGWRNRSPAFPVFGSAAHLTQNNPFYRAAQDPENLYPKGQTPADPYPILRRYWDANELVPMSEFTIVDMAVAAGVVGVLSHP